jgi:hypothetical protein
MVGVSYSNIKPEEVCYIVVKTPDGKNEYLEGQFLGVAPEGDPAWKKVQKKGFESLGRWYAKPVRAIVTDPSVGKRGKDPIRLGHEPFRDYEVISRREYVKIINNELDQARQYTKDATENIDTCLRNLMLLANNNTTLRRSNLILKHEVSAERRNVRWDYLGIGIAFGLAAALGFAAYQNSQSAQKAPDSLEIRIEQP